jgi:precorrin-3B C17-methyltransferase
MFTKDSGEAGGFQAKADAAQAINATLIVVERPRMDYPVIARDFQTIIRYLDTCLQSQSVAL